MNAQKPDKGWKVHARDEKGRAICGAKTRPGAKHPICHKDPIAPNGRCNRHGAKSPGRPVTTGIRSPAIVSGRLGAAIASAREDPALLDLREGIAALAAVTARAHERVEERDTPEFRKRAKDLLAEVRSALATDPTLAAAKLVELSALLDRGCEEDSALDLFASTVEKRAKRVEAAWGIALARDQAISANHLRLVLIRFLEGARLEFGEEGARRLSNRLGALLVMPDAQSRGTPSATKTG